MTSFEATRCQNVASRRPGCSSFFNVTSDTEHSPGTRYAFGWGDRIPREWCVMLDDVEIDPAKLNADILFDVPDEELERAATVATWQISTLGICTNWYTCGWPL